jgi:hypothetical protein
LLSTAVPAGTGWLNGLSGAYHLPLVDGGGVGVVVVAEVLVVVLVVVVVLLVLVVVVVVEVLVGVVVEVVVGTVVVTQFLLHGLPPYRCSVSCTRSTANPARRNARRETPTCEPSRRAVYMTLTTRHPLTAQTQWRAVPTVW